MHASSPIDQPAPRSITQDGLGPALQRAAEAVRHWQGFMPAFSPDPATEISPETFDAIYHDFCERLWDNYPFFHPLYAGQMLKPPHPVAVLGYVTAMLINPNNHALDGGPATARMEKEVIARFARLYGFSQAEDISGLCRDYVGHLTSSGTLANLEALWVAKCARPGKSVVFASNAHYTHRRMCELIEAPCVEIPATADGRLDVAQLLPLLEAGTVGTVVATLGTTALGQLDPLDELLELKARYGFRIHVDAAYGGYYALLARDEPALSVYQGIARADSVVVDPHKQGLQPYGCGCVLFADPAVRRFYDHDSPYTYFTGQEDDLHLGEISLECSRAGAAAAALWLTLQAFPLSLDAPGGMKALVSRNLAAARSLAALLEKSPFYRLHVPPALDIVTYFPLAGSTSQISSKSRRIFHMTMQNVDYPLYLATCQIEAADFARLHPDVTVDRERVTILRSCLLKPEHAGWTEQMAQILNHHIQLINV